MEKKFSSNRHGIRVKFMNSFQDENKDRHNQDEILSNGQTTLVRTEPCFYIQSSEDQVTKHFYENPIQLNNELTSNSTKTIVLSDKDSLEEELITIKQVRITLIVKYTFKSFAIQTERFIDEQNRCFPKGG